MKAIIYHNPDCGTSRKTLEILEATPGVDVTVVEYLKTPPTRDRLAALYARAGMTPRQGLRTHNSPAAGLIAELGLAEADNTLADDTVADSSVTDAAMILDAMIAHPILINRPLVETGKGVRLCRPQDIVREIL